MGIKGTVKGDMVMRKVIIMDIEYDAPPHISNNLPKKLVMPADEDSSFEELCEQAEEYISNCTEYCTKGFSVSVEDASVV